MTDELHYFCPKCQSPELLVERSPIIGGQNDARCELCGWHGPPEDLLATITPENASFWTGEKVGQALLVAAAKFGAGPMIQVLELIGLVPKITGSEEEQASAQFIRELVIKDVLAGVATAAFESAAMHSLPHFQKYGGGNTEELERVFSFAEPLS